MPMLGVNLPAHFMIMPAAEGVEVLVDAYKGGEVCYLQVSQGGGGTMPTGVCEGGRGCYLQGLGFFVPSATPHLAHT